MTRPLDPYTLRQASARWPDHTLNKSAAQSFLRSLADDAEWAAVHQPATGLHAALTELIERLDSPQFPWISTQTLRTLLAERPA